MGTVASKGSGRCAVLFRSTVRIIKPSNRMNGSRLSNTCTEADSTEGLLMTLTMDRFAGEKAGPGLLAPAPFNRPGAGYSDKDILQPLREALLDQDWTFPAPQLQRQLYS